MLLGILDLALLRASAQQLSGQQLESDVVLAVAFSPDGKMVAGGGEGKAIGIWDPQTGKLSRALVGHSGMVRAVAFSRDGQVLASGGDDRSVRLWDPLSGGLKRTLPGHPGFVNALAVSPDGKTVVSTSLIVEGGRLQPGGEVRFWDMQTGELKRKLESEDHLYAVAFSPDGQTVAAGRSKVALRDAQTGKLKRTLAPERGWVQALAFSPDGKLLAGGGGYPVQAGAGTTTLSEVRLWNVQTGELQRTLTALGPFLASVAFSPDGKVLATGTSGALKTSPDRGMWVSSEMKLWNALTGELLWTMEGSQDRVWSMAFSPDGKTIVYCDGGTVTLVEADTGAKKQTLMRVTMKPLGR